MNYEQLINLIFGSHVHLEKHKHMDSNTTADFLEIMVFECNDHKSWFTSMCNDLKYHLLFSF